MKKLLVIALSLLLTASILMAQTKPEGRAQRTPEQRAELLTQRMTEKLTLNQDQAKKLEEVHLAQAEKMDKLKEKYAATRKEFRSEVMSVHQLTEDQYKAILTPEQYQKYLQLKEERKQIRDAGQDKGRKRR